jgi:hypothetical protein
MAGSPGDGEGEVFLAHAWTAPENRKTTVGPWHWWNVYKDHGTATAQAAEVASTRWRDREGNWHGRYEVLTIRGDAG